MRRNAIHILICLLACACIALAAKVTTDYNHSTDFLRYKTWSWLNVSGRSALAGPHPRRRHLSTLGKGLDARTVWRRRVHFGIRFHPRTTKAGDFLRRLWRGLGLARRGERRLERQS